MSNQEYQMLSDFYQLHVYKYHYYEGDPLIDDCEYDRYEANLIAKYGREVFDTYYTVGYDSGMAFDIHLRMMELKNDDRTN